MGCETGNCPPCKVEVGAIYIAKPFELPGGMKTRTAYHLFILYTDGSKKIVYRGGPEYKSRYAEAAEKGKAQEFRSETVKENDLDYMWGKLITHRMEGLADNYDYIAMVDSVTVAEGEEYCGLDEKFTHITRKIGELGLIYDPVNAIQIDNSNATARTILHEMGLPEVRPDGGKWTDIFGFEHEQGTNPAPGWGRIFDLE